MITVSILTKNGVQLDAPVSKAIVVAKIIWATASGAANTKILYAKSLDRRDRPDELIIVGTPASFDLDDSNFEEVDVAIEGTALAVAYFFNPLFIEYLYAVPFMWNGVKTSGWVLEYTEGAFLHRKWYLTDQEVIPTTTTTTAAPTTTTTAAPATTTTTEEEQEVTTTTTEEVTTTTTEAEVTTTTTEEVTTTTTEAEVTTTTTEEVTTTTTEAEVTTTTTE
jgi:hypothetical protein